MTLTIPDDILKQIGLSEHELLVEVACRLFDSERLTLWSAAQLAALSRVEFENELRNRGIAIYRPTPADLVADVTALENMGA